MAKKASSAKKSSVVSSAKTVKPSPGKKNSIKAAKSIKAAPVKKKASAKTKSTRRVSYKEEYIKLLQKTNKTLSKEIKSIHKAIAQPEYRERKAIAYEAFPPETLDTPPVATPAPPAPDSIEQQILNTLQDLELQVRSRDMAFEDLISGSAKLGGHGHD